MTAPRCHQAHPGVPCTRTAPGGYCPPARCHCGACPWWRDVATNTPDTYTAFDRAAVLSSTGRRASLGAYRAAQQGARA